MKSFTTTARFFFFSLILGFFALVTGQAHAGALYADQRVWMDALGSTATVAVETFESFPEDQPVSDGTAYSAGFSVDLLTGESMSYLRQEGDMSLCAGDGGQVPQIKFTLTEPSKGFALVPQSQSFNAQFCGYRGGALVGCVDFSPSNSQFVGVVFSELVDNVIYDAIVTDSICAGQVQVEQDGDSDGFTASAGDCDDTDPNTQPGAVELCDYIDNDCDGIVDDSVDQDGDGYVICHSDCDDDNPNIYPGATEVCDGVDQDCDGIVDEGTECYDDDEDGYTEQDGDCNDADPMRYPGKTEVCDGVDNNCDGQIDASAADAPTWCVDVDGDGYTTTACVTQCSSPAGYSVSNPLDCNDAEAAVHPGAAETCDGLDNDCDGLGDGLDSDNRGTSCFDDDGDGYTENQGDCDDGNAVLSPADVDVDGYSTCDGDCDDINASLNLDDSDDDGITTCGGDCDDVLWYVHPGAAELCNRVDDDCDGTVDEGFEDTDHNGVVDCYEVDQDGDGVTIQNGDCNDSEPEIYPGAEEICNGLDDDCDTLVDGADGDAEDTACYDDDGDGYTEDQGDCNDDVAAIHPGAEDIPDDGIDQDCDGEDETSGGTETPTEIPGSPTPPTTPVDESPTPTGDDDTTVGDDDSPEDIPTISTDFESGSGCACQSAPDRRGGLKGIIVFLALLLLVIAVRRNNDR